MNPKDAFGTFKSFPQLETRRLVLRELNLLTLKIFSFYVR